MARNSFLSKNLTKHFRKPQTSSEKVKQQDEDVNAEMTGFVIRNPFRADLRRLDANSAKICDSIASFASRTATCCLVPDVPRGPLQFPPCLPDLQWHRALESIVNCEALHHTRKLAEVRDALPASSDSARS